VTYGSRSKGTEACVCVCVCGALVKHLIVDINNKGTLQPAPLFTAQQAAQTVAILDFSPVCSFSPLGRSRAVYCGV